MNVALDMKMFWIGDLPPGEPLSAVWTSDTPPPGMYKAQYQGAEIDTETGEATGGTWVDTAAPSEQERAVLLKEEFDSRVTRERDRRIAAGVLFNGVVFQSRATDRENIAGAAQLALMATLRGEGQAGNFHWHGGEEPFAWIAADNTLVQMDAPTVINLAKTAAAVKQAYTLIARGIKDMDPPPADIKDDALWRLPQ